MIRDFIHKGLQELWDTGRTAKIDARMHARLRVRLDALEEADVLEDLNVPGFDLHALRGFEPTRYTLHVNGPWCVTFEFANGKAGKVDYEQYH